MREMPTESELAVFWPGGRPAPPRLPSAKSVVTAMLTAFDSVRGDVEYETRTGYNHGVLVDEYRSWTWPAQPVAGQRQLSRVRYSGISPTSATVKLTEDRGTDVVNPPDITGVGRGQVTMACFTGSGQTGCGYGERDTRPGTWSRFTAPVQGGSDLGPGGFSTRPCWSAVSPPERGTSWAGLAWTASRLSS